MNLLSKESSPYLLQHKNNPVNWVPWSDKAFKQAEKENKLVLISIGYSACHWCHVMEHECFEDEEVATFMNQHFINIKVDREERPDVDQLYMEAVQLMTQSGGWPLNCFTLPNGKPFFGGTYFPKPNWLNTLNQLVQLKAENFDKIEHYANNLTEKIQEGALLYEENDASLTVETLLSGVEKWKTTFDLNNGGTQRAPKFPLPNNYLFLLNQALLTQDKALMNYVELTLDKMAQGGIYDQVGGGFSRYSVDETWKVPHFEKMLYDNAQLINLYAHAYSVTNNELYKRVTEETITFCLRELKSSNSFYCALDADSEGVEGKYYVWSLTELKAILQDDFDFASEYFNFNEVGKWEGNYIPLRIVNDAITQQKHNLSELELSEKVKRIREKLLYEREKRVRPATDTKTLTSWNALLITALVNASVFLENPSYLQTATKTATFLTQKHLSAEGELYRTFRNETPIEGFLDDYALFIEALISLYKVSGNESWLKQAKQLTDATIDSFYDDKTGLFYYSASKQSVLAAQQADMHDDVIPSSNSIMAQNLHTLSIIYDNQHYLKLCNNLLKKITKSIENNLFNYSNWGILLQKMTFSYREFVIVGKNALEHKEKLSKHFVTNTLILASTKESELPIFKHRYNKEETLIFVCENKTCKAPIKSVEEALKLLQK